jgi:hypothetical protein
MQFIPVYLVHLIIYVFHTHKPGLSFDNFIFYTHKPAEAGEVYHNKTSDLKKGIFAVYLFSQGV